MPGRCRLNTLHRCHRVLLTVGARGREQSSRYPISVELVTEINGCEYLFLDDISQPDYHTLRLIIAEGRPAGEAGPIKIGSAVLEGGTRIEVTDESRIFELVWSSYVAYCVTNESFGTINPEEQFDGKLFRTFSKSHFIEFVGRATIASAEYPGPMQHYEVVCQDHVVDIISIHQPTIRKLR